MLFLSFLLAFGLLTLTYAELPFLLGDIPLAVQTPYLHAWISGGTTAPKDEWPTLYSRDNTLGWEGIIRVDGQAYQWLGHSQTAPFSTIVSRGITPTRTKFTMQAGPMKFNVTFFSPIEPNNYTRQSIPFSYLFVDGFVADDGMPHMIQMYSDITCDWSSHTMNMTWDIQALGNMVYHRVAPQHPLLMLEDAGQAKDAITYYATPERPGLTWMSGEDLACRKMFNQNSSLTNSSDTEFRPWTERRPTFALAIDLGSISPNSQPDPVVWALGLVRDPLVTVTYETGSGPRNRTGYYKSAYTTIEDVISDFLADFPSARQRGQAFDDKILNAALQVSPEYAGIVSLVTRQIFASMDITIPENEGGQLNASDVKIFMKDIGMSARANPVEVIYAALPALIYFNPSFVHDLLLPLLEFQSSTNYPQSYASPDLGIGYPTIYGNTSAIEELAIEHCGNMLIMVYAHAAKSGDSSLISKYHTLLQKWATYLVENSFHTGNDAHSADDIGYLNMSNLALKGILGVYSMGKIDEVVNRFNTTFKDKANELFSDWKKSAVTETHIQAEYGKPGTWGLMYNLFPAIWLETGLIDDDILNHEAQYYLDNAPPEGEGYSLDNVQADGIAYPHWALMTAAIIPSAFKSVRDTLVKSTYAQANNVTQTFPLPMRYKASTGEKLIGTKASAAQGAAFAIMAKSMPNVNINAMAVDSGGNGNTGGDNKNTPVGAIVGGVIGGLALILVILSAIFFWRRHMHQIRSNPSSKKNQGYSVLRPFNTQAIPVSPNDPRQKQNPDESWGLLHLHASKFQPNSQPHYPMTNRYHPSPPPVPLASKEREVLQQNELRQRHSESAVAAIRANPSRPPLASESGGGDFLRAEVDDLRREVEAMRDIAGPPPIYQ